MKRPKREPRTFPARPGDPPRQWKADIHGARFRVLLDGEPMPTAIEADADAGTVRALVATGFNGGQLMPKDLSGEVRIVADNTE